MDVCSHHYVVTLTWMLGSCMCLLYFKYLARDPFETQGICYKIRSLDNSKENQRCLNSTKRLSE